MKRLVAVGDDPVQQLPPAVITQQASSCPLAGSEKRTGGCSASHAGVIPSL